MSPKPKVIYLPGSIMPTAAYDIHSDTIFINEDVKSNKYLLNRFLVHEMRHSQKGKNYLAQILQEYREMVRFLTNRRWRRAIMLHCTKENGRISVIDQAWQGIYNVANLPLLPFYWSMYFYYGIKYRNRRF
jgi:hypothetical protein